MVDFILFNRMKLGKDSFKKHGGRMLLKQDKEIEIIKAINHLIDKKGPCVRRNYIRIRTKIR